MFEKSGSVSKSLHDSPEIADKKGILDMNSPSTGNIHAFKLQNDASVPDFYHSSLFGQLPPNASNGELVDNNKYETENNS